MDRPYALPLDLAFWRPLTVWGLSNQTGTARATDVGVFPLAFELGVSETLTLIFTPLPLQLRWQPLRWDGGWAGLYFNVLGPLYTRLVDFNWSPKLELRARQKLLPWLALEAAVSNETELSTKAPQYSTTFGPEFGLLAQILDFWAVGASVTAAIEYGDPRSRYLAELPRGRVGSGLLPTWPLRFETQVFVAERFQFEAAYQWLAIPRSDYVSHGLSTTLTVFW